MKVYIEGIERLLRAIFVQTPAGVSEEQWAEMMSKTTQLSCERWKLIVRILLESVDTVSTYLKPSIIKAYCGIDRPKKATFREIAEEYEMSVEVVRQHYWKGIRRLRGSRYVTLLRDLLEMHEYGAGSQMTFLSFSQSCRFVCETPSSLPFVELEQSSGEQVIPDSILRTPVMALSLSKRIEDRLIAAEYLTVESIICRDWREVIKIRMLGRKGIRGIRDKLREYFDIEWASDFRYL